MLIIRRSHERGITRLDWLQSFHTFSFGDYHDPRFQGFRTLRVINQDIIAPSKGFGMHAHHDMEIITYIIRGALRHQDSMGTDSVIHSGEIQRMTAGKGITHSEFNASDTLPVELLQIWIFPNKKQLTPSYEQIRFHKNKKIQLLAAAEREEGCLLIHQDVKIYRIELPAHQMMDYHLSTSRFAWLQIITGDIEIDHARLSAGDGVAVSDMNMLQFKANQPSELLLFDLH